MQKIRNISRKLTTTIVAASMLMTTVMGALPVVVMAQELPDNYETSNDIDVSSDDSMSENHGNIRNNHGSVENNCDVGRILNNYGSVKNNNGTVGDSNAEGSGNYREITTNNGTVVYNQRSDEDDAGIIGTNNGLVKDNHGVIDKNLVTHSEDGVVYKGVAINYSDGEIRLNSGKVGINYGTITTSDKGIILENGRDENLGTGVIYTNEHQVNKNNGVIKINKGSIPGNLSDGVIEINNGVVNNNYGTIDLNGAGCSVNDNVGGMVKDNYGDVGNSNGGKIINQYNGVAYLSEGTSVENMYSRAVAGKGTIKNYFGGEFSFRKGYSTYRFEGTITNNFSDVDDNTSDIVKNAEGQFRSVNFKASDNSKVSYGDGFIEKTLMNADGTEGDTKYYINTTDGSGKITVAVNEGHIICTGSGSGQITGEQNAYSFKYTLEKQESDSYTISITEYRGNSCELQLSDFELAAVRKRNVTVINGDGNGTYYAGNKVSIKANAPATGKRFKEWTSQDGVSFANAKSEETSFILPDKDVTVEAVYEDIIYTVKATNDGHGSASADPTSGTMGTSVTIKAAPGSGYEFKEWQVVSGDVALADKTKATTSFRIKTANVEIKAVFELKPTPDPAKIDISKGTVTFSTKSFTYKNKVQRPTVKSVTLNKKTLKAGTDFTVSYSNKSSKKAGTYKVTVTGIGKYTGSVTVKYTIKKAANPMKVSLKKKKLNVRFSDLKNKDLTISRDKYLKVSKKQGNVTYKMTKGDKKISLNSKTGKIRISKKLKKGTYSINVSVKAAGNRNYKATTKIIAVKIVVK